MPDGRALARSLAYVTRDSENIPSTRGLSHTSSITRLRRLLGTGCEYLHRSTHLALEIFVVFTSHLVLSSYRNSHSSPWLLSSPGGGVNGRFHALRLTCHICSAEVKSRVKVPERDECERFMRGLNAETCLIPVERILLVLGVDCLGLFVPCHDLRGDSRGIVCLIFHRFHRL